MLQVIRSHQIMLRAHKLMILLRVTRENGKVNSANSEKIGVNNHCPIVKISERSVNIELVFNYLKLNMAVKTTNGKLLML